MPTPSGCRRGNLGGPDAHLGTSSFFFVDRPYNAEKSAYEKGMTRARHPVVTEGEVWAVPVAGAGHCALVVARAPDQRADMDFAFAYLQPTPYEYVPAPNSIGTVHEWRSAWLGLVSITPFRNGRWKCCGALPSFDPTLWPVPPARNSIVNEMEPVAQWDRYPWG